MHNISRPDRAYSNTEPFTVNDGDRIAQLVVARCEKVEFVVVDELTETERGTGGFGSTGR